MRWMLSKPVKGALWLDAVTECTWCDLHKYNNASAHSCRGRKRWILSVPVKGALLLDAGAVRAIRDRAKSLFSAGIVKVVGDFAAQDAVSLCDEDGAEFGRGLCNYRHDEVARVQVGVAGGCRLLCLAQPSFCLCHESERQPEPRWAQCHCAECLSERACSYEHGKVAEGQMGTVDMGRVDCPAIGSHSMR